MRLQLGYMKSLLFLLTICGGLFGSVFAQPNDSIPKGYEKKKIRSSEIQLLYGFYDQDGVHSAVTGGTGTEKLDVHAPAVVYVLEWDSIHQLSIDVGVDIISSASTDKIDFRVSSASIKDARSHANAGYRRWFPEKKMWLGLSGSGSIESDYLSGGLGLNWQQEFKEGNTLLSAQLYAYFDNLRWGWLNPDYYRGVRLIYPEELRGTDWFEEYRRRSYSLSLSWSQVVNQRLQIAFSTDWVYQQGLLSTPFHRVYFQGETMPRVENLPRQRWKWPMGIQLNYFATDLIILRSYYRYYWDNFGLQAHTLNLEMPFRLSPSFSIYPFVRLYDQQAVDFFAPFQQHLSEEEFYTSDYDLSDFQSLKTGIGLRYAPLKRIGKTHWIFQNIQFRYAHYTRSDGLQADMLSVGVLFGKE
jgi:hypothetical protein